MSLLKALIRDESGQDLIEYALISGFISLVSLTWLINIGVTANQIYGNINTQVAQIP